ncbi:LacI family DNA-binding transcriptional regulator, partial [Agromyces humi]|uniref:LacI family DNA-binding transcriptional regulator n=1 Tax=Agromyces humi TaxID=1766800 RepID=UPI001358106E
MHQAAPPRPTLADVAAKAGVSPSTASLAFSGSGPVSDATKERVLAAASALGYAGPDPRARSLRQGRSGIVGVVLEERVRAAFLDPVKIQMLDGITEGIAPLGAGLLLLTDTGEAGGHAVGIESAPVDAVVLVGCSPRLGHSVEALRRRGIPAVAIEGDAGDDVPKISIDNREATRRGAEYLKSLGHTDVALVTLPFDAARTRGRLTPELERGSTAETASERLLGAREVFPH